MMSTPQLHSPATQDVLLLAQAIQSVYQNIYADFITTPIDLTSLEELNAPTSRIHRQVRIDLGWAPMPIERLKDPRYMCPSAMTTKLWRICSTLEYEYTSDEFRLYLIVGQIREENKNELSDL